MRSIPVVDRVKDDNGIPIYKELKAMAKKKSARGDFNMSSEIRTLLQEDPKLSSKEVFEKLQERFPNQKINRNSCNVAFSHARRRLGIRKGAKKSVRLKRPSVQSARTTTTSSAVDMGLLKAARKFMTEAGSSSAAISAIQQLEALQIN